MPWRQPLATIATPLLRALAWLGRHELGTIVAMLVVCACVWGFVELADDVGEGDTMQMDRSILLSLRDKDDLADPIGPRWVEESMRDFTALGGVAVLTLLSGAAIGFLLIERKSAAALLLFAAVFGGWVAATLLKMGFDRARPDLVPHGSHVYTASFPSGHAMMAAVTYLTIGALLARLHQGLWTKAYFLILAALLTIAVGISRVYLGVHWPTDVLAGWTIGGCWALLCWTAAKLLQQRGQVEQAKPAPEGEPSEVDAAA